jgi:replicative DNA helicase
MSKISKDNLGYLGLDFQYRVILQILTDNKFANSILDMVNPNYFEDSHVRIIVATIKDAFEKHEAIPDLGSLKSRLLENVKDEIDLRSVLSQLRRIEEAEVNDTFYIQETAIKFCKTQELIKAMRQMDGIIKTGTIDDYDRLEEILKKALEKGDSNDGTIDVCDNIDSVLSDDYRNPIPTGIEGLDEAMDGGLAKGELAIILAAWGVGKTTMITKLANHAKHMGYNVMQIFFEDSPKVIQRKHISCWSKIPLNELQVRKVEAKMEFERFDKTAGKLKLVKLKSDSTTIPKIKQLIRKNIAKGFKPDLILIDYIDCVLPSKNYNDVNEGQGAVMRELETMLSELDIAGWTATQGNRSSIKADIVEGDQMGGSIKKAQIGHFLVSIAKTLEQKETGKANMAILKSRFGKSGIIFEDIIFDNSTIQIDMSQNSQGTSFLNHGEVKEQRGNDRVKEVMELAMEQKRRELEDLNN